MSTLHRPSFDGIITKLSYGSATLHIKQDCCGVVAKYDGRTCEVCAIFKHNKTGFTHFVTFISIGHLRDFESNDNELTRLWCSDDE